MKLILAFVISSLLIVQVFSTTAGNTCSCESTTEYFDIAQKSCQAVTVKDQCKTYISPTNLGSQCSDCNDGYYLDLTTCRPAGENCAKHKYEYSARKSYCL